MLLTCIPDLYVFQVELNVSEGLTCSFHQQAVKIDVRDGSGEYAEMGRVSKTIVATPNLKPL